jgi:hypothetical protein
VRLPSLIAFLALGLVKVLTFRESDISRLFAEKWGRAVDHFLHGRNLVKFTKFLFHKICEKVTK